MPSNHAHVTSQLELYCIVYINEEDFPFKESEVPNFVQLDIVFLLTVLNFFLSPSIL